MKAGDGPIVVEQTVHVKSDRVWKAITELELMHRWYFGNIPAFRAEVGFETRFNVHNDGRDFLHIWTVTEVAPGEKLVHGWKYEQYPGDALLVWELFAEGDTTRVRVTTHVMEDFPDDIPEFRKESCRAGWEYFVNRLRLFLEGE